MSTIKTDTLQNVAGTLSVPVGTVVNGSAKAWVNFNGTGTVAIVGSFNVSSITDRGLGQYTVNLTTALSGASYAAVGSANFAGNNQGGAFKLDGVQTTTTCPISTSIYNSGYQDSVTVTLAIFR